MSEINNLSTDNLGYTFIFDPLILGALPTRVGIVWTDGNFTASTQVEFFGPVDEFLGRIGPVDISDNSFAGQTAEDRFFGAINTDGIRRMVIRSPGGNSNLTVDHLQYGLQAIVAESSSLVSAALGLVGLAGYAGWRRRRTTC